MSLMLSVVHELIITNAQLEMKAWRSDDNSVRDDVSLTVEVGSSILNSDPRKVTGEITLLSSPGYESRQLMDGTWIFYEENRFHADVEVPEALMMRIWNCYAARPEWVSMNLWEAPEVTATGKHYEGAFRIGCRAGSTRSSRED